MKNLCVFCGSSVGSDPAFQEAAKDLAGSMVRRGLGLVYGGGKVGLMGVLADEAIRLGGRVIGVIPRFLETKELAHAGVTEMRVVGSMHDRKVLMAELSDGFIAMPGGFGTLEEFSEVLTWGQLGLHEKPCGLLNVAGFYDHLLKLLDHMVATRLLHCENRKLVLESPDADELLDLLEQRRPPGVPKWLRADET